MKLILLALATWAQFAHACHARLTPLEALFSPWFRGPASIDIASSATQYAGRTTLASGSATVVISTAIVKSDSIIYVQPLGNANVGSGANRVTEVKTISEGGYFTLGTMDGVPIARDTTLMWEVKLPGKTA